VLTLNLQLVYDMRAARNQFHAADTTPRVSIIPTLLNAERFLDQAMQNVPRQCFSDFDPILLDEGSTDGGTAIAQDTSVFTANVSAPSVSRRGAWLRHHGLRTLPEMRLDRLLNFVSRGCRLSPASSDGLKPLSRQMSSGDPDHLAPTASDGEYLL
jgi:hypothetical protein